MSTNLTSVVWNIADQLRGLYRPAQYGTATLPFLILRRIECVIDAHREEMEQVLASTENENIRAIRLSQMGLHFWNESSDTLEKLADDSDNLATGLLDYISNFSDNVRDIFEKFDFAKTIARLDENQRLFTIVRQFKSLDLHPDVVTNADMGEVFENLIFRFNTASNETAGEHFTPRDAIRLLAEIVVSPDKENLKMPGVARSIYDPTVGTGGMLSVTESLIFKQNADAEITLAGQELNPESYAVCKSDMIAKGQAIDAIRLGDTLYSDEFAGKEFDYCLSNPPYGGDWKAVKTAVEAEAKREGRFSAGLPRVSDAQMLFLQHLVSKMAKVEPGVENSGGRAGIVLNGSPLFTGGAESGESNIRKHLIESDLVDAIIALPTNMFYNTGIATYLWILDNHKPAHRQGKVQLIDATARWTKLRKNLGSKNREIGESDRAAVVKLYEDFAETEQSKILEAKDFGYWEITVEQPLRLRFEVTDETRDAALATSAITKLTDDAQVAVRAALESLRGQIWLNRDEFVKALRLALKDAGQTLGAPAVKALWVAIGERDEAADICIDPKKGTPEPDTDLRDTELVPFRDDIDAYFEREVKPHVPDAWIDTAKTKEGYEIPFTRLFYKYVPPRPLAEIDAELDALGKEIIALLSEVEG